MFSVDTCTQEFKLQKLLEAYRQRSALENEQQPLRAMIKLNSMVADFLSMYDLTKLEVAAIQQIPYLARCSTYEAFVDTGNVPLQYSHDPGMRKNIKNAIFSSEFGWRARSTTNPATFTKHG